MSAATDAPAPPATPQRRTLGHQPALDGLRGLAVGAVLLYHVGLADNLVGLHNVTQGGFLGVSAFLTLSGFLITSLLILEFESVGHISLGGFWGRRFRRLMPASLATLAAVAVLTPLIGTQNQLRDLPGEIWSSLTYVTNWRFIAVGSDYASTFNGAPSPLKHFWSLAVEEQCYFVLPFIVAVAMRVGSKRFPERRRLIVGSVLAVIVVAAAAASILIGGGQYANSIYMGTHTRIAELAVGGLLAVVMAGRTKVRTTGGVLTTTLIGPLALGMVVAAWGTTDLQASWLYRGGLTVHAIAVALVIASAVQPNSAMQRLLSMRPLMALGRISYGVYLFHWPIVWWLTSSRLHLPAAATALVQVLLTFGLATLSYHVLEQPIRTRRWVVGSQRILVPTLAIGAVAILAFTLPAPDRKQIVALSASKEAVIPTTAKAAPDETQAPEPVRVMVVGDSFALSVGLGLEHWAKSTAKIGTLNTGVVGCGFGRGGMNRGIGLEREWPDECKDREARLQQQMAVFQPDVVLCAGGMWDVTDRKLEGESTWTHIGQPHYDEYLTGEFQHMTDVLSSGGAKVVWATAPDFNPQYNPQSFMGKPPYFEAEKGRSEKYNAVLKAAVATRPGTASILDLASWMNAQPGGEFSPDLRIDGVHFTEVSTDKVADEFIGPALVAAVRGPN